MKKRYRVTAPHNLLLPRVRAGDVLTFDTALEPVVGDIVALWYDDIPETDCVLGILMRWTPNTGAILRKADGSAALAFRRRNISVHPAVGGA